MRFVITQSRYRYLYTYIYILHIALLLYCCVYLSIKQLFLLYMCICSLACCSSRYNFLFKFFKNWMFNIFKHISQKNHSGLSFGWMYSQISGRKYETCEILHDTKDLNSKNPNRNYSVILATLQITSYIGDG